MSLPHFSFTCPLNCFQLPSMMSQSMAFPFVGRRAGGIAEARLVRSPGVRRHRRAVRMECACAQVGVDPLRCAEPPHACRVAARRNPGSAMALLLAAREHLQAVRDDPARSAAMPRPCPWRTLLSMQQRLARAPPRSVRWHTLAPGSPQRQAKCPTALRGRRGNIIEACRPPRLAAPQDWRVSASGEREAGGRRRREAHAAPESPARRASAQRLRAHLPRTWSSFR